jgi:hypothetical protein
MILLEQFIFGHIAVLPDSDIINLVPQSGHLVGNSINGD